MLWPMPSISDPFGVNFQIKTKKRVDIEEERTGFKNAVLWPHSDRTPIAVGDSTNPRTIHARPFMAPLLQRKLLEFLEVCPLCKNRKIV